MFAGEGFLTNDMLLRGVQRGPSGRGTQFVDIKFKLSLQYTLLTLDIYYYFKVNKSLSSELHNQKWQNLFLVIDQMDHPVHLPENVA